MRLKKTDLKENQFSFRLDHYKKKEPPKTISQHGEIKLGKVRTVTW